MKACPEEMSKTDLKYWINWAKVEIVEWQWFVKKLNKELSKRK